MSVTIATHNGTRVSREHNVRNRNVTNKEKHIDPNGVHEIWHDEKIRMAYQRLFGEAVEEYNAKQTREERKISNYYRTVCRDASKSPCYEILIGVYGADCSRETKREILKEFVSTWKDRNPNLELIGAYYHADEEGKDPHVHIDYIPIAHGYKKGMSTQVGLNRALFEQDGFQTVSRHNTAQIQWERRENAYLESLCAARGLDVAHPMRGRGEHLETFEFKAQQRIRTAVAKAEEIEKSIEIVRDEYEAKRDFVRGMEKDFDLNTGVKPIKKHPLSKEIVAYEVPAPVWETQRVTQMAHIEHEKAADRLQHIIETHSQLVSKNKKLQKGNDEKQFEIDKFYKVLDRMHPDTRAAFLKHLNSIGKPIPQIQRPFREIEKELEAYEPERTLI